MQPIGQDLLLLLLWALFIRYNEIVCMCTMLVTTVTMVAILTLATMNMIILFVYVLSFNGILILVCW